MTKKDTCPPPCRCSRRGLFRTPEDAPAKGPLEGARPPRPGAPVSSRRTCSLPTAPYHTLLELANPSVFMPVDDAAIALLLCLRTRGSPCSHSQPLPAPQKIRPHQKKHDAAAPRNETLAAAPASPFWGPPPLRKKDPNNKRALLLPNQAGAKQKDAWPRSCMPPYAARCPRNTSPHPADRLPSLHASLPSCQPSLCENAPHQKHKKSRCSSHSHCRPCVPLPPARLCRVNYRVPWKGMLL